ncbi:MAG: hypothetical protein GX610_03585 [Rhodococcus sp.]|nr:hypothetical protein [Rhodococcus sp. (in: high G+C Gram-positive bacteria)]
MVLAADQPFELLVVEQELQFEAVAATPAAYTGELGDADFEHDSTEVDVSPIEDSRDDAGADRGDSGGDETAEAGSAASDATIWDRTTIEGVRRHLQCSRIQVARWKTFEGPGGARYRESDRTSPLVARLREPTFDRFMRRGHDFDKDLAAPTSPVFDIDVVYTWVDGDDEAWQAEKQRYAAELGKSPSAGRVVRDERFRNRDELKYSLRSVELFAPWVRRIHIVTADQCPPWLNIDHPRINLVSHRDIYSDLSWLPTFNSSGIETQLHHIPGLADRFLYFNDDFFLGQLCDPADFFEPNGVLKFFPSSQRAYEGDIDRDSEEYIQADKNAIELFRKEFPSVGREIMRHVPYASDRNLLAELEAKYPDQFAACASSRFRSALDLRPIAFMQYHFGYQHRLAMRSSISHRYLALWKPSIRRQLATVEQRRAHKTFCINDVGLQPGRTADINQAVVEFLEAYFPQPSQFELAS